MSNLMNSSEKAYDRDEFLMNFIGNCCSAADCSLDEYDKSIDEINEMIAHSIDIGDEKEVSQWRKLLQRTRVEKRRCKARMIESKNRMEIALT